jgi:hypothetical protein
MVGSKRYFKRSAYSRRSYNPSKNRPLRKDQRCAVSARLSRTALMPLVHKQKFD